MAAGAGYVLVAGVTDLTALLLILFGMRKSHIRRVRKIMTGPVVAETRAVAVQTFHALGIGGSAMFNCPTEIVVCGWRRANNDRRLHQHLISAAHDRHRMAQVAFHADDFGTGAG